jgi:glyoxylase-like metal-dependent hydrolase (beta-lactamase superfamily II)
MTLRPVLPLLLAAAACEPAAPPVVHRFDAGEAGVHVNAYLIETPRGVIAVDATLTESSSKALRARIDSLGKPLLAVLLTHGHPDHYNGVTNLLAGKDVPVVATAGADSVIRASDAAKEAQWRPMFGDEWPPRRTFPTRTVADGETVSFGGVKLTVHALGPGESHHDAYWVLEGPPKVAFVGDAVLHQVHAYTADGHTTEWIANLDRLSRELADVETIYPGHGEPGGTELLMWQRAYLEVYRGAVAGLSGGRLTLSDPAKATLVERMKAFLPNERLAFLIPLGADAVAAELAGR